MMINVHAVGTMVHIDEFGGVMGLSFDKLVAMLRDAGDLSDDETVTDIAMQQNGDILFKIAVARQE
jgi:hypothetical protein